MLDIALGNAYINQKEKKKLEAEERKRKRQEAAEEKKRLKEFKQVKRKAPCLYSINSH